MKPFLMGTETEYAVSGRSAQGLLATEEVYGLLNEALREERLWMADIVGGRSMYLEHGGRFYIDHGLHPEYATPECQTPGQIACYDKAGERLLDLARTRVLREQPELQLTILKNNLDPIFPDQLTYGCHESYTCWMPLDEAAPQMIPHLVSRILYAGAGCLSAHASGSGFELSQRARHLSRTIGTETTSNRAIFCTRVRKVSDFSQQGWTRAHLIGKDSQRAPFGIYLTFATTGLLFLLLNRKRKVGKGLELANPVKALRDISCDPWLDVKVPLTDGRQLTALEIQETYLAECEREVQRGGLPDWAAEAVRHWRETLAALDQDPLRLAGKLDAYSKLLIYGHELQKAGYSWRDLHRGLRGLMTLRAAYPEPLVQALLTNQPAGIGGEEMENAVAVVAAQAEKDFGLDRLRLALRVQALDLRYHELGGLYDQLAALGQVQNVVVSAEEIDRATREPPPGGRAAIRSMWIKTHREASWCCDWQYLFHDASRLCVDLRDPFAGVQPRTVYLEWPAEEEEEEGRWSILELLGRSGGR